MSTTRVPTNLVTGFLGVGKTTALIDLLRGRPEGSKWAVLVNEYGEVAIDGALLEDAASPGVTIKEVSGGCICCTSALFFKFALAHILKYVQPERLLIETTGVGHPARLLDLLRSPAYVDRVDLRATMCILDPSDFVNSEMRSRDVFRDQIELADVLVFNKADQASDAVKHEFLEWGRSLFPPKLRVAITEQGHLNPDWLDLDQLPGRRPLFPEAHEESHDHHVEMKPIPAPSQGHPIRKESRGLGQFACGWIFSPDDIFAENQLIRILMSNSISRLKGVFHTVDGWVSINRKGDDLDMKPSYYRRDSRVEAFARDETIDWGQFERDLIDCIDSLGRT